MAPSPVDQSSAPPEYRSQRSETPPVQLLETQSNASTQDLVSARSHPVPSPSPDSATPRLSDVHFQDATAVSTSRPSMHRRRYSSLPYSSSSVTFPPQLRYQYVPGTSITTTGQSENSPETQVSPVEQRTGSQTRHKLNPTNYISLSRKSTPHKRFLSLYRASASIKGDFTVNPYLHIPTALLVPASPSTREDQNRKNLKFEVENGGINVNVYLVGEPSAGESATNTTRTTIDMRVRGNEVTTFPLIAKIHTPMLLRPPFHLSAAGVDGYHALHLPSSFHGLVTIKIAAGDLDAHISLSRGFASHSMILSETAIARSYFVGELGGWARDKQGWDGDRADIVVARGMVRLQILGERESDMFRRIKWRMGL